MKAGTLLQDTEGVLMIAGIGIAAFLIWKGYTTAKGIANTGGALADKVSQIYTSAKTSASNAVTETEIAMRQLISPDSIVNINSAPGASPAQVRQDALNTLNGLRTAKAVTDTLPQNATFSLWKDFTDWYNSDTTGKAVRDSFYAKNPDGVFYD